MEGETTSKRGRSALRDALTAPLGPHVDDETLALIVTTEAAGEDVDAAHAAAMAHIERCATCAAAYDELAQMMFAAVADMNAAAGTLAPGDAYAALLAQQLEREGLDASQAGRLADQAAQNLPLVLSAAPQSEDIDERWLATALPPARAPAQAQPLVRALRETAAALALYLRGLAEETWAQRVSFHDAIAQGWNRLQMAPGSTSATSASVLREQGPEWEHPGTLTVDARAERLDALSCRLIIHIEGCEKPQEVAHVVRLKAGSRLWQATTGEDCVAQFEPLPIASLSQLLIEITES